MKIRTVIYVLLLLCLLSTFQPTLLAAQDPSQWHLPKGAIARLGKGPINDITYSLDGSHLAMVSDIGVWIYDTLTGTEKALFTRYTGTAVYNVVFSPDGRTIAVTGGRQEVQLWDIRTQTLKGTLDGHTHWPVDVAFSPDGQTIAIADMDQTTQLWNVATMTLKCTLEGSTDDPENEGMEFFSLAYGPKGDTFAIGAEDGTVNLWDTATGKLNYSFIGEIASVGSFAYSPDGTTIATLSPSNSIRLWDTTTGKLKNTLEEGIGTLGKSIAYSPNGSLLAIPVSGGLQLWDTTTSKLKNMFEHTMQIENVAFSPDGRTIATVCSQKRKVWHNDEKTSYNYSIYNIVWLWDMATGKQITTLEGNDSVEGIAFSPDGRTIATLNGDSTTQVWETLTGVHKYTLDHTSSVVGASFSLDRHNIITIVYRDRTAKIWDTDTHICKHTFKLTEHTDDISSVAFNPEQYVIATGSLDGSVQLWEIPSGRFIQTLVKRRYTTDGTYVGPFSPDGNTIVSLGESRVYMFGVVPKKDNKILNIHNLLSKESTHVFLRSVAYSPDGNTIAIQMADRIILWDIATEQVTYTLEQIDSNSRIKGLVYSPDGKIIATRRGGEVQLWDIPTQTLKLRLPNNWAVPLAFSPNGRTIVTGYGSEVWLWNTTTGILENTLTGHAGEVKSVTYSLDGKTLATASQDGTVLLWDLTSPHVNSNKED